MNSRLLFRLCAGLAALLGGGCATYQTTIESFARPGRAGAESTSFCIHRRETAAFDDRLSFQEAAGHLRTALSAHGLWEAPDEKSADLIIDLDFGVGPARAEYDAVMMPALPPTDRTGSNAPSDDSGSRAGQSPRTSETPDDSWFVPAVMRVTVREKHLTASCRENKAPAEGRPPVELWRVSVGIADEGTSLRAYLPVLATAVMKQIGRTSDGVETGSMRRDDEAIAFVKKGL